MNRNSRTFKITLGGICLALAVIFMFAETFVPGVELTLFAISSLFTAVVIIETGNPKSFHCGTAGAALMFAGASILGLVLIPNKVAIVPYVVLFGYYPILKFYIEKIKSGIMQVVCKTIYFAAVLSLGLLAFKSVIAQSINLPDYPVALLIVAGTLVMLLYDFVLTFLINWYIRRFKTGDASSFKLS